MGHYSEMDFLFGSVDNRESINQQLEDLKKIESYDNTHNIFDESKIVVYKRKVDGEAITKAGTNQIKNYLKDGDNGGKGGVYKHANSNLNPYVQILKDFGLKKEEKTDIVKNIGAGNNKPGSGLLIKAADLAYLKDLGVYPMNRMVILRRFPEGCFVPEDLNEMTLTPISTVIGWLPPDKSFGNITFNERWTTTDKRFDVLIADILQKATGLDINKGLIPVPDFAQGLLYQFYNIIKLTEDVPQGPSVDEDFDAAWDYKNIPVGDPNVLREGPFRNPEIQNIESTFVFDFDTTYEQKMIGDVDPGSAMLDILDNLYAMGTSNMRFYWSSNSPLMTTAKAAITGPGNNIHAWWQFIKAFMTAFWEGLKTLFSAAVETWQGIADKATADAVPIDEQIAKLDEKIANYEKLLSTSGDGNQRQRRSDLLQSFKDEKAELEKKKSEPAPTQLNKLGETAKSMIGVISKEIIEPLLDSILASTISIYRFEIRGSIELMVGGSDSSTPWYLTIGNPYSPWLATNHIVVKSAAIDTSPELGFNDQPQWLKVTFQCQLSRALGKQELMRMFNNTFRRTYSDPNKAYVYNNPIDSLAPKTPLEATFDDSIDQESSGTQSSSTLVSNKNVGFGTTKSTPIAVLKQKPGTTATVGIGSNERSVYTGG